MQRSAILTFFSLLFTIEFCLCTNETQCFNDLPRCGTDAKGHALCCLYPDGVCCGDGQNCCDKESVCHLSKGICDPLNRLRIPLSRRLQSIVPLFKRNPTDSPKPEELCPSKKLMCPGKATCCPGPYIGYDCCPMPNGVCCANFQHCCPHNTICDSVQARCIDSKGQSIPWYKKTKAVPLQKIVVEELKVNTTKVYSFANSTCPSNRTRRCNSYETCCSIGEVGKIRQERCCKAKNAVCCLGGEFCCPRGTDCDIFTHTCIRKTTRKGTRVESIKLEEWATDANFQFQSTKVPSRKPMTNDSLTLVCPGGKYSCPNYMTCCPNTRTGKFGCCPFPNAACCSDAFHCCPTGSICDLEQKKCIRGGLFMPLFLKKNAHRIEVSQIMPTIPPNEDCPDKSKCPNSTTCCQLPTKDYGCCPLDEAVCCSDKIHCCPHGTVCDVAAGGCKPADVMSLIPFKTVRKESSSLGEGILVEVSSIMPNATKTFPANEECPDKSECPDETTCCQLPTKDYGCCPLDQAVCCSDKIHCCPHATVCDIVAGGCKPAKAVSFIPFKTIKKETSKSAGILVKVPRIMPAVAKIFPDKEICPDKSKCPDETTCCQMTTKDYGCCPLSEAVCCADKIHCCPHDTVCDLQAGGCNPGNNAVSLLPLKSVRKNTPLLGAGMRKQISFVCPGGLYECSPKTTCCRMDNKKWGCCPFEKGVCCNNNINCCPNGYKCDMVNNLCMNGNLTISF